MLAVTDELLACVIGKYLRIGRCTIFVKLQSTLLPDPASFFSSLQCIFTIILVGSILLDMKINVMET